MCRIDAHVAMMSIRVDKLAVVAVVAREYVGRGGTGRAASQRWRILAVVIGKKRGGVVLFSLCVAGDCALLKYKTSFFYHEWFVVFLVASVTKTTMFLGQIFYFLFFV